MATDPRAELAEEIESRLAPAFRGVLDSGEIERAAAIAAAAVFTAGWTPPATEDDRRADVIKRLTETFDAFDADPVLLRDMDALEPALMKRFRAAIRGLLADATDTRTTVQRGRTL